MKPELLAGGVAVDDRGVLSYINDLYIHGFQPRRMYMVENFESGFIRAWHGHQFESKIAIVVRGAALVYTIPIDQDDIDKNVSVRFVLSSVKPQALYIPPGYYNGFKTLSPDTQIMFLSNKTVEESAHDDIRKPFDAFGVEMWTIIPR
jgi:dTDP-4-dehydrorhamnose 3,5-epimerase